jgi:hypothetical protein
MFGVRSAQFGDATADFRDEEPAPSHDPHFMKRTQAAVISPFL